jgi:XTP/dITP diphosphohydrolase
MTAAAIPGGRLLVATGNAKKLQECLEILGAIGVLVLPPSAVGYDPAVIEDEPTCAGNAVKKARAGMAATGLPTLADDSGIEALALGGRPGVHSARYAALGPDGAPGHGNCDDEANNARLIAELAGVQDRRVQYRCVIACAMPGRPVRTFTGIFAGVHTPHRAGSGGFGYDPYVFLPDLGCTVAEMPAAAKHARSHRGQALRACAAWLAAGAP